MNERDASPNQVNTELLRTADFDQMKCCICQKKFKETDEVCNCEKMHVFHIDCFEQNDRAQNASEMTSFIMIKKCPICNEAMV